MSDVPVIVRMRAPHRESKRIAKLKVSEFRYGDRLSGAPEPVEGCRCVRVIPIHRKQKTCVCENYHSPADSFLSLDDSMALKLIS